MRERLVYPELLHIVREIPVPVDQDPVVEEDHMLELVRQCALDGLDRAGYPIDTADGGVGDHRVEDLHPVRHAGTDVIREKVIWAEESQDD